MNFKKLLSPLFIILLSSSIFAQYQITIDAVVLDKETHQPLAYVNTGFVEKSIKTISNKEGKFTLIYDEEDVSKKDVLQLSALGYETLQVRASGLFKFFKNTNKVYLIPKPYALQNTSIQEEVKKNIVKKGNIYGKVSSNNGPLQSATISVKNTFMEAQSDIKGNYSIDAKKGDILRIYVLGMKEKEIVVTDVNNINIELEPDSKALEEVFLKGESKKEELLDMGLSGDKNFDAVGTSMNVITADEIGPQYYNLKDLLFGKFAALNHSRESSIYNNIGMTFEIDGNVFTSIEGAPFVDPQNIESLTVLTSLAATNKYGTVGRGGVIIIKTKTYSYSKAKGPKNSALVKNNKYTENVPHINNVEKTSQNIKELEKADSYNEALAIYNKQKKEIELLGVPFYLDASQYFMKWDTEFAYTLLSRIAEVAYNNPKALKTLAFKLEELGKLEEAKLIYQRIAVLRPNDAQSYRDLALIYTETANYTKAMNLYKQMLSNSIEGVDFSGLQNTIDSEFKHLLSVHRTKVEFRGLPSYLLRADFKYDIRIVYEWNDPYSEFELQFVNPQKKYYTWSHSQLENKDRMSDEIKNGYNTEEYIIDNADPGEWIINIKSFNQKPLLNPNYLKYTVYKNYGLSNETKTVKVIKLYQQQQKVTLDKFIF